MSKTVKLLIRYHGRFQNLIPYRFLNRVHRCHGMHRSNVARVRILLSTACDYPNLLNNLTTNRGKGH